MEMDGLAPERVYLYTLIMCIIDLVACWRNRGRLDTAAPAVPVELEERLHEKRRRDAERDKQIASLQEAVAQLAKAQARMAAALDVLDSALRDGKQSPTPQLRADVRAELEQRMLDIARNSEKTLRDFNVAFYDAELRKREIASYYQRRRLQRLARGDS